MHLKGDADQNFQAFVRTLNLQDKLAVGDRGWHVTPLLSPPPPGGTALWKGSEKLGKEELIFI